MGRPAFAARCHMWVRIDCFEKVIRGSCCDLRLFVDIEGYTVIYKDY